MASDKYTEQQLSFVEHYLELSKDNENYDEVAKLAREAAGYSNTAKINTIVDSVKELILDGINLRLAKMLPKLLNKMEHAIDNPAEPGAKNAIAAVMTLLDRGGIVKVEKSEVNIKAPDGVLILPSKQQVT